MSPLADPAREAFVFDATPLMYLAKAGVLEVLAQLPNVFLVPPRVFREVVEEGRKRGATDVQVLERLIAAGRFRVRPVGSKSLLARLREDPRLSEADREALGLAVETSGRLLADDESLRSAARARGAKVGGSLYLLHLLVERGLLSSDQAVQVVERMIAEGWFCSPLLYRAFVRSLG